MPKELILKHRKEFLNVFNNGLRCTSFYFSLIYVLADDLKFAFIVSKKNVKKAVDRNYSRRVTKELVRHYIQKFPIKKAHIVIKCNYNLKELKQTVGFSNIKLDLFECLNQVNQSNK